MKLFLKKYLKYGLYFFISGLDINKSEKIELKLENKIVNKDQYFGGNKIFLYMLLFFFIGSVISTKSINLQIAFNQFHFGNM